MKGKQNMLGTAREVSTQLENVTLVTFTYIRLHMDAAVLAEWYET